MRTRWHYFTWAVGVLMLARVLAAAEPSVAAQLSASEVYEGDSVVYEVQLRNLADESTRPDMSAFDAEGGQYTVAELEHGRVGNTFRMIVNGRDVSPKEDGITYVYRYKLTPKQGGRLTLPPVTATIKGKKISGPQLPLNVIAAEKQDIAIMQIEISKPRVIPMQPFEVNLKILLKPLPPAQSDPLSIIQPPALQINLTDPAPEGLKTSGDQSQWLGKFLVNSRPKRGFTLNNLTVNNNDPFAVFDGPQHAVLSLYTGREKRRGLDGKDYDYFVYELKRTFIPVRPGTYKFGAATLKGTFADGIAADGNRYNPRNLLAVAPEKSVVCEMPEPKPANFSGAIGKFLLRADVNTHDLRIGDPLTLKLDFERLDEAGALDDISAPDLSVNAQLTADFAIVDKSPSGQVKGNVKSFSYVLRPKKAGVSIPALAVAYLNIQTGAYEELASAPIALKVIDAPQLRPDELISGAPIGSAPKISGREKGLFQNITELSELNKPAVNPPLYLGAVVAMWAAYGAGFAFLALKRKRAGDTAWQNRVRADSEASAQLLAARKALKTGDAPAASLGVQRALTALIGYRSGIAPAGMTARDAQHALEKSGVPIEARTETARLLEDIEASKYGSRSSVEAEAMVSAAERLVPLLQKAMDAKK